MTNPRFTDCLLDINKDKSFDTSFYTRKEGYAEGNGTDSLLRRDLVFLSSCLLWALRHVPRYST